MQYRHLQVIIHICCQNRKFCKKGIILLNRMKRPRLFKPYVLLFQQIWWTIWETFIVLDFEAFLTRQIFAWESFTINTSPIIVFLILFFTKSDQTYVAPQILFLNRNTYYNYTTFVSSSFILYRAFHWSGQAKFLDVRLESIFNTAPAASKNNARFKRGQNQLKNKQHGSLI